MNHTQTQGPFDGWAGFLVASTLNWNAALRVAPAQAQEPTNPPPRGGAGREFIDVLNITKT